MNIEQIIKNNLGTIVDVRTPEEFEEGCAAGAMNIPLHEIPHRLEELKTLTGPLVLCCASGNRSGQAHQYLTKQGIACYNAGPWYEVQDYQTQQA